MLGLCSKAINRIGIKGVTADILVGRLERMGVKRTKKPLPRGLQKQMKSLLEALELCRVLFESPRSDEGPPIPVMTLIRELRGW